MAKETEKIYIDTHIIVDLFRGDISRLSKKSIKLLNESHIIIPSMSIIELEYLYEIKRINYSAKKIVSSLELSLNTAVSYFTFDKVAKHSLKHRWTRDPFDRLIVGEADLAQAKLITLDEEIHKHYKRAVK